VRLVGNESFSQIPWHFVHRTAGDSFWSHKVDFIKLRMKVNPIGGRRCIAEDQYYELPEGQQFSGGSTLPNLTVSPDGKQFVYSTAKGLYLRSMDELTGKLITGTEGVTSQPFSSPDGKWVGYFSVVVGFAEVAWLVLPEAMLIAKSAVRLPKSFAEVLVWIWALIFLLKLSAS